MIITETKLQVLKDFLEKYREKKKRDELFLRVFEEIVVEYESAVITNEINKKGKK